MGLGFVEISLGNTQCKKLLIFGTPFYDFDSTKRSLIFSHVYVANTAKIYYYYITIFITRFIIELATRYIVHFRRLSDSC